MVGIRVGKISKPEMIRRMLHQASPEQLAIVLEYANSIAIHPLDIESQQKTVFESMQNMESESIRLSKSAAQIRNSIS